MSKARLSYPAAEILVCLLELVARDAGYEFRGVGGWASAQAIVDATRVWGAAGLLGTHAGNGRVLREDVRAPGQTRAVYVYRITQRGLDTLAELTGTWAATIRPPDPQSEARVLLRDGVQFALEALCGAGDPGPGPGWDSGRRAWSSCRQLTRWLAREDDDADRPPRWILTEDLRWLVRHGFAEEQDSGRFYRYRVTPAGAALRPLRWLGDG